MRQKGLFPGVVLAEEELRALVAPRYQKLWRMVRDPFDDLLSRLASDSAFRILTEGERAQWLHPQIVHRAHQLFEGDPEIKPEYKNQQFFLRCGNQFAVIPKKLRRQRCGDKLTFSSYNTFSNVALWAQRFGDGLPDLPRLLIGYLFINEMTDIKIWIAYPRGKTAGIYLLMPDQDGGIMGIHEPSPTEGPPEEGRGFRVRPKRKGRSETEDT